jgi:glycosyltransferase involved in cell wall biosynthesis
MFGSGLAVIALHYPALPEIVKDNENGLLFQYSAPAPANGQASSISHAGDLGIFSTKQAMYSELIDCLEVLLCMPSSLTTLSRLRSSVSKSDLPGWEETWKSVVLPKLV